MARGGEGPGGRLLPGPAGFHRWSIQSHRAGMDRPVAPIRAFRQLPPGMGSAMMEPLNKVPGGFDPC